MNKALSLAVAAVFAVVSVNALAASHAGAQKDDKKMEVKSKDGKAVTTKDGKKVETKEEKKK
jgi:cytochrome oxidase Cu insertion factor (SCO1/SenC/PrrC family)